MEVDIQDYARQILEAHGSKAVAEVAQKAVACEEKGENEKAEVWRRVEAALLVQPDPVERARLAGLLGPEWRLETADAAALPAAARQCVKTGDAETMRLIRDGTATAARPLWPRAELLEAARRDRARRAGGDDLASQMPPACPVGELGKRSRRRDDGCPARHHDDAA